MRLLALLLLLFNVACKPSPQSILPDLSAGGEGVTTPYISSIAHLKSLYKGESCRVGEALCIEAQVTANNLFGEHPDRIVVEDGSGAIEISVDLGDMLYRFGVGTRVKLVVTELWIGGYGATLILGGEPTDDEVVGCLSVEEFGRKAFDVNYDSKPLAPDRMTIADLTPQHISRYVTISDLDFVEVNSSDGSFCRYDEETHKRLSTTHLLCDSSGEELSLFVPSTSNYADDKLPEGRVRISGIVNSYGRRYSITLVERRIEPM